MLLTPKDQLVDEIRDVFISHRSVDDKWAEELAEWLELNSVKVWIDNLDTHPGQSVVGAINHGLTISRHVALVITPSYFADDAEWTTAEWEAALFADPSGRRSRVLPLHVKDCSSIPPLLSHINWIDFRDINDLENARKKLLRTLQGKPARYPLRIAGQILTPSGAISAVTLLAERASVEGKPDPVQETLASNLLPALRIPRYVWSFRIAKVLSRTSRFGPAFPNTEELREIIRTWQREQQIVHPFMPVFARYQDRLWSLNRPNRTDHPLAAVADGLTAEALKVSDLAVDPDHRRIVVGLLRSCIGRYCHKIGLVQDDKGRFWFPSPAGVDVKKRWTLKVPSTRTVTSRYVTDEGNVFFHHDAVYLSPIWLGKRWFLQVEPAIAFSNNGTRDTLWSGSRVGPMAMNWRAREKNIDVFRDLRFWIYQLAKGQSIIRMRAGDQPLHFDTRPTVCVLRGGIEDDQSAVEELIQRLPVSPDEPDQAMTSGFGMDEEYDGDL